MYSVDRGLEPREELLWEGTRVYGIVTCSFAKPARPTIIAWETEEKVRIQQRVKEPRISWGGGGGARMSIPESHVARTVLQVHDRVHLGVQWDRGECDRWQLVGSETGRESYVK
jgi:hypothetical protein